jgi:hemolysin activation/secretion protein
MRRYICLLASAILLNVVFLSSVLHAAVPLNDPGQLFLEQEKRKKERELLEKEPAKIQAPESTILPEIKSSKDAPCFRANHIVISGRLMLPKKIQKKIRSSYEGQCLPLATIDRLLHEINNAYIEHGYVTSRAQLARERQDPGTLKIDVMNGTVESIRLNDHQYWRDRLSVWSAFPGMIGRHLQLRDLEQGIDQLNRLPSNAVKLTLWPGKENYSTAVKLENTPKDPRRYMVVYDNYGQETTGVTRIRMSGEFDNLFGLNDMNSFHYIGSRNTNSLAANSSIAYGYWTLSMDASYSEYLSVIDNAAELFGQSYNVNFTANRVIWRGKNSKTSIEGLFNLKQSTRMIGDVLLSPQPITVVRFGGTHMIRTPKNVWNFNAHYSRGLTYFGAVDDDTQPPGAPHAQFDKLDAGINLYQPLTDHAQLRSVLHGQYSFDALYNSEQITLGDNSTVRGFQNSNSSGDSGLYMQHEISFTLPYSWKQKIPWQIGDHIQPYSFIDAGYTKLKQSERYSPMIGSGGGVRFGITNHLNADIAFAVPLYADGFAEAKGTEFYLMLGARW